MRLSLNTKSETAFKILNNPSKHLDTTNIRMNLRLSQRQITMQKTRNTPSTVECF